MTDKQRLVIEAAEQIFERMTEILRACEHDHRDDAEQADINELICAEYPFIGSLDEVADQVLTWRDAMKAKAEKTS